MRGRLLLLLAVLTRIIGDGPLFGLFFFLHFQKRGHGGLEAALFNGLLFAAWAFLHSLFTLPSMKRLLGRIMGEEFVRSAYVIFSGLTLTAVLLLWRPLEGGLWHFEGAAYWALTALYVGCVAMTIYASTSIDYLDFVGVRTLLRKRRNLPAKPPVFSTRGLYAYCRHPMYLFFVLALWTGPVMTYTRLEFSLLATVYFLVGTLHEERSLARELGDPYTLYQRHVPMWIPRLTPWRYPGTGP